MGKVVVFDPEVEFDKKATSFFDELCGQSGHGGWIIDTSQNDCLHVDNMLKEIIKKRKQLDKLRKKLEKMEDLTEKVDTDRDLLRKQQSFEKLLKNDFECIEKDSKGVDIPRDNMGNLILPGKDGNTNTTTKSTELAI